MVDVFAPAKVNLFLHITGKHEGYHTLQTVCFFPSIGDRLTVTKKLPFSKSDELTVGGAFARSLPTESKQNFILKVLTKLREHVDIPYYNIHLQKQLPVAAGVGGGSSDVGAVLRVISRENNIDEKPSLVSREGSLRLAEIILSNRKELIEKNKNDDRDADEINIFKAFLVINKEVNSKQKLTFATARLIFEQCVHENSIGRLSLSHSSPFLLANCGRISSV